MNKIPFQRIIMDCTAQKVPFPRTLGKDFGRLLRKIDELWGSPAAVKYLDELIMPARNDRQGFPVEVAMELTALKQLHEFAYPPRGVNLWDPYNQVHRERFKDGLQPPRSSGLELVADKDAEKPRTSVYKSWIGNNGSRHHRKSPIANLYPSKGLSQNVNISSTGRFSVGGVEDMLDDAEQLLGMQRTRSATGLYEQILLWYPRYSAYPYLRLLELYCESGKRDDFERVSILFSKAYPVGPIRWVLIKQECLAQLDGIAEALIEKRAALIHKSA
jgi:hypothetical protein